MSWMSDNYEKVIFGGGAVVALALAFFGWRVSSGVEDELVNPATGRGKDFVAVAGAEKLPGVISSMQSPHQWQQAVIDERPLDLFTGIALFAKKDSSDPVDLWKDPPVHGSIPNRWFLDNRIEIGFADSAQRDPDRDGFKNLEEFDAGTLPNDPKSHPALIAKLTYVSQEVKEWLLMFSMDIGADQNQFKYIHQDRPGKQIGMGMNQMAKPGDILGFKEPGAGDGRWKLLKVEEKEMMNERTKTMETLKFAVIEEQKANKKGDVFEVPRKMPNAEKPKHIRRDRKAVLELRAIGFTGKTFKVEERTTFALPPGGKVKNYFLKEVTDESATVVIAEEDGQKKTVVIPLGQFPDLSS